MSDQALQLATRAEQIPGKFISSRFHVLFRKLSNIEQRIWTAGNKFDSIAAGYRTAAQRLRQA
jgi:hypothetical protein